MVCDTVLIQIESSSNKCSTKIKWRRISKLQVKISLTSRWSNWKHKTKDTTKGLMFLNTMNSNKKTSSLAVSLFMRYLMSWSFSHIDVYVSRNMSCSNICAGCLALGDLTENSLRSGSWGDWGLGFWVYYFNQRALWATHSWVLM